LKGSPGMLRHKASPEAEKKHAADVALAARFDSLLEAVSAADAEMAEAEARRSPVTETQRLAKNLDAALTSAMHAAYAAQRAAIGLLGYDDRIYARKAKARPDIRELTARAERLLTLRENHRMNRIPDVPPVPEV
jgi:hypothetical protein